jgi:hypothetical protein
LKALGDILRTGVFYSADTLKIGTNSLVQGRSQAQDPRSGTLDNCPVEVLDNCRGEVLDICPVEVPDNFPGKVLDIYPGEVVDICAGHLRPSEQLLHDYQMLLQMIC